MKKHIKYPETNQFRNIVYTLNREFTYVGLDDNGDGIYDNTKTKPTLTFKGSVKLHGTNSSVCYNKIDDIWSQSRGAVITPQNDNYGFAFFAEKNKEVLERLFIKIIVDNKLEYEIDVLGHTISIFGEWAGKGVQKGVGISEVEKGFFIFGVKISKIGDPDFKSYWLDSSNLRSVENRIFNVEDFETYTMDVDFNMPQLVQNKFIELTNAVEKECPISKALGVENGVGEGIVWSTTYNGTLLRFKVKGDKHSVSKVKKLAEVDVEKLNSVTEFVNYSVTKNRFDQAIETIFGTDELDIKKLGDIIRWMVNDVNKEELDTMVENNLEPKDVNKYISTKTREMFMKAYNY